MVSDRYKKIFIVFFFYLFIEVNSFTNSTLSRVKRQNCGFICDNGDCISTDNVCDGTIECADGSDETAAKCSKIPCPPYLFRCKYGACINKDGVCNGIKNCADNSDETGVGCTTGSSACSPSEFRCANDDCINAYSICDGRKDCQDGSDETKELCMKSVCPPYLLKCNYGACVDKNARCNGVKECADGSDEFGCDGNTPVTPTVSPPVTPSVTPTSGTVPKGGCLLLGHPTNGKRTFNTDKEYIPNAPVASLTAIFVKCNAGYKATGLTQNGTAYCANGNWIGDVDNVVCKRKCLPLNDPSIVATCHAGFSNTQTISCSEPVEGMTATTTCKPFFFYGTKRPRMTCTSGRWTPSLGSCVPACGIKKVNAQTLVIGGSQAVRGEYPWLVAIYRQKAHICGGSIISRKFVISAAHCFAHIEDGTVFDKNEFELIAGKFHRKYDDELDKDTQQVRKIISLIVHENYRARNQNYQSDIALLEVEEFELNADVQPVCIDWSQEFEELTLADGNNGVVAGWGFTQEGQDPAEELKKVILPVQNKLKCKEHLPYDFYQKYYTPDKICAGYINNATNVCSGDSGGGYYFNSNGKYYIRGIVSLAPTSTVGCNKNLYALYTKISTYSNWIEANTGGYI